VGEVLTLSEARLWRHAQAGAGRRVVFTNGVFDLLHVGHTRYLSAARALGDALIVGLNSDASARALKPGRPFVPEGERAEVLAALAAVDVVVIFEETNAVALVDALRPDIYVKGGDWGHPGGPQPPEAAPVRAYGGRVDYIRYNPGHSTSELVERIVRCQNTGNARG
jgi:D-glycero-beta-D-manno-heptose 1-phosphate adenylyltransferase